MNIVESPAFERLRHQVEMAVRESGRPEGFDADIWLKRWLYKPIGALGGRMPAEYMESPEGVEVISNLIGQIQHSVYG